jgi:hypothetical protein
MLVSPPDLLVAERTFAFAKGLCQVTFQPLQVLDLAAHRGEAVSDKIAHVRAGFCALVLNKQQFADLPERKPEFLGLVDEMKALNMG